MSTFVPFALLGIETVYCLHGAWQRPRHTEGGGGQLSQCLVTLGKALRHGPGRVALFIFSPSKHDSLISSCLHRHQLSSQVPLKPLGLCWAMG